MKKTILLIMVGLSLPLLATITTVPPGTNTIQQAVANASPGDTLLLQRGGTYVLDSFTNPPYNGSVVVDKAITIETDQGSLGPQAIVTIDPSDPAPLPSLFTLSDSVTLHDFTLDDQGTNLIPQGTLINTRGLFPFPFVLEVVLDSLNCNYSYEAIFLLNTNAIISNNTFISLVPSTPLPIPSHTAITLGGVFIEVDVQNNFFNGVASGDTGTIFCHAADNLGFPFGGPLNVTNNQLISGNPVSYFLYVDADFDILSPFKGQLHIDGNEFSALNGSNYFFSTQDLPADRFTAITVTNNIDLSNPPSGYKGLIAFDGTLPGNKRVATDPTAIFTFSNNSLTVDAITANFWVPYNPNLYPGGLFGVNSRIYQFTPIVPPITDLVGTQYLERFASQGDLVNYLTWENGSPTTDSFNIYKNSLTNLIASQLARPGTNSFAEHRQKRGVSVTYYITAVEGSSESSPVSITVP